MGAVSHLPSRRTRGYHPSQNHQPKPPDGYLKTCRASSARLKGNQLTCCLATFVCTQLCPHRVWKSTWAIVVGVKLALHVRSGDSLFPEILGGKPYKPGFRASARRNQKPCPPPPVFAKRLLPWPLGTWLLHGKHLPRARLRCRSRVQPLVS